MAITAALVASGNNFLRYLVTATSGGGEAVTITSTGAATPDLLTDSAAGPIKKIASVKTAGYGKVAAGTTITQALARSLWLSDAAATNLGLQGAACRVQDRSAVGFVVDAVQGVDTATASITVTAANAGTCYVEVAFAGAIG